MLGLLWSVADGDGCHCYQGGALRAPELQGQQEEAGSVPEKIISLSLPSSTLTIPCSLLPV